MNPSAVMIERLQRKIAKKDLLQPIIEDDLTSHTATAASLDSASFDSENDSYVSFYVPKQNGELRSVADPSDIRLKEIYNLRI